MSGHRINPKEVTDIMVAKKFTSLMSSAASRDIEFNLKLTTVKKLLKTTNCYFTGVPMNLIQNDPNMRSIDRLDNELGYVEGNVVACCARVNQIKGGLTLLEIKNIYEGIKHLL